MGLLDKATKAEDIKPSTENYRIRALLAGGSGSGKTTSAMSVPGKKLLIDLDQRAMSVAGVKDLDILEITEPNAASPSAWRDVEYLFQELWMKAKKKEKFLYDAIIWDGITSLGRFAMNRALLLDSKRGLGGAPAQQHYLPQMKYITDHIKGSLGLPCHVIFTCHLELHEDYEDMTVRFLPKITGKLRTEIGSWFDETYMCQRQPGKDGKTDYSWLTAGTGKLDFLKSSLNQYGAHWTDPVSLKISNKPWGFQELINRRFKDEKEIKESK